MRRLALVLGLLLTTVALFPLATAYNGEGDTDAFYAVITYPAGTYDVDSEVDVTVHVFEAGDYGEVDSVELMVGFNPIEPKTIEMSEDSTGKWTGTFTIEEGDVMEYDFRYVSLMASCYVSDEDVEDVYGSIMLEQEEEEEEYLDISLDWSTDSVYVSPGESIDTTWEIRYEGDLVDPDFIELDVDLPDEYMSVEPERESMGVYTYELEVPNDTTESYQIELDMDAQFDEADGYAGIDFYLNFFHIWADKISLTDSAATFDLYVSDMDGEPVDDADVNLYYYWEDNDYYEQDGEATATIENGTARIELSYRDLNDEEDSIYLEGSCSDGEFTQYIDMDLPVRAPEGDEWEPEEPDDYGFDVVTTEIPYFEFSTSVHYAGEAYLDGDPLESQEMYWYLTSSSKVITYGSVDTDATGEFQLDFTTPSGGDAFYEMLQLHFDAPVEDEPTYYYEDDEMVIVSDTDLTSLMEPDNVLMALSAFKDDTVSVEVATLEKGQKVTVTVSAPGVDGSWMCMVLLGNDPDLENAEIITQFSYLSGTESEGLYTNLGKYASGKFTGTIFIPENLPDDNYFVIGALVNQDLDMDDIMGMVNFKDFIKVNYVTGLKVGQGGGTNGNGGGDGDGDGDGSFLGSLMDPDKGLMGIAPLYWLIIIIIIVIAVVAGVVLARKKGAKAEAPAEEPTAAEGPSFEGGPGPAAMPMPPTAYDQMQPVPGQAEYPPGAAPPAEYPPAEAPPPLEYPPAAAPPAEYPPAAAPPPAEYPPAAAPPAEYPPAAAPPPAEYPPAAAPPPAEYPPAAPPPAEAPPQTPPPVEAPPPAEYTVQPPGAPPGAPPMAPPAAPEPAAPPMAPPVAPPAAPEPATPPMAPPVAPPAAPEVAAPPAAPEAAAPPAAAPAAAAEGTMNIKCQKCGKVLTIPRKRPIKVTCPNCGASGTLR